MTENSNTKKKIIMADVLEAIEKEGFAVINDDDFMISLKDNQQKTVTKAINEQHLPRESEHNVTAQLRPTSQTSPAPVTPPTPSLPASASLPSTSSQASASSSDTSVQVLFSYDKPSRKWTVQDFVQHYHARYKLLKAMIARHQELPQLVSIGNLSTSVAVGPASVIGLVKECYISKNGHFMIDLEDPTGNIRVVVSKTNKGLMQQAADLVVDEVIGVQGSAKQDVIFANAIVHPGVPFGLPKKKAPTPGLAVFLSDIHVGSKQFLHEEFNNFLSWIQGDWGDEEQRALAQQVKYVLISGDVVDGVGIYPQQEKELEFTDIYDQYEELSRLLSKIPTHINIIIAPGNHDAMRLSEPQPSLRYSAYADSLKSFSNVTLVSNPGMVTIHASEGFEGFHVLLYHGYSFDYYVANVPSIRTQQGYDNPCAIMQFLLKRRHLAPAHSSSLYLPEPDDDALVVKKVPDIFLAGHVHRTDAASYHHILLLNASCWQGMTSFQERMGHNPSPAKAQVFDLQSRELRTLDFGVQAKEEEKP